MLINHGLLDDASKCLDIQQASRWSIALYLSAPVRNTDRDMTRPTGSAGPAWLEFSCVGERRERGLWYRPLRAKGEQKPERHEGCYRARCTRGGESHRESFACSKCSLSMVIGANSGCARAACCLLGEFGCSAFVLGPGLLV